MPVQGIAISFGLNAIGGLFKRGEKKDLQKLKSAVAEMEAAPNTRKPSFGVLRIACQAGFAGGTDIKGKSCSGVGSKKVRQKAKEILNSKGIFSWQDAMEKPIGQKRQFPQVEELVPRTTRKIETENGTIRLKPSGGLSFTEQKTGTKLNFSLIAISILVIVLFAFKFLR